MAKPKDPVLYARIKRKVYNRMPQHSAYRSGILVKEYKKAYKKKHGSGNAYQGRKIKKKGLDRWFKEKWKDQYGKPYYSRADSVFRPSTRITKKTPVTYSELTRKQLSKAIKEKKRKGRVYRFKRK